MNSEVKKKGIALFQIIINHLKFTVGDHQILQRGRYTRSQNWTIQMTFFLRFFGLPMGLVLKRCSIPVTYHIIYDLSWPQQNSINDHMEPERYRCFFSSFDNAVALAAKCGVAAIIAKLDLVK